MSIPPIVIQSLFILPLIFFGVLTSYTDFRYGKIKNKHLFWGYVYVLFLYILLAVYSVYFIDRSGNLKYIIDIIRNGLAAFAVGYLLWRVDLWAAGDAKLFPLFALLIPLEFYSGNYISYFPSAVLLVDAFLFIFIIFLLGLIRKALPIGKNIIIGFIGLLTGRRPSGTGLFLGLSRKSIFGFLIETGKLLLVCICALIILECVMLLGKHFSFSVASSSPIFSRLFFLITQVFLFKTFGKHAWFMRGLVIVGITCGLTLLLLQQGGLLLSVVKSSFWLLLFMGVGMQLVYSHIESQEIVSVRIRDISPGMFLTPESTAVIAERIRVQKQDEPVALCCSDGLTGAQTEYLREVFIDDPDAQTNIYKTFSFAPFLFLACIYNIATRSSFLFFLLGE